jgi:hypothetical protein
MDVEAASQGQRRSLAANLHEPLARRTAFGQSQNNGHGISKHNMMLAIVLQAPSKMLVDVHTRTTLQNDLFV